MRSCAPHDAGDPATRVRGAAGRARRSSCSSAGLTGAVLFDPYYVLYYAGFAFAPTERPIAFVLNAEGEGGMLVPRLEREHAQANASVDHVADYPEYPSETASNGVAARTARGDGCARAVRGRPGRVSVGARLPRPVAHRAHRRDAGEDHRLRRGPDGGQEPSRDRTDPRELEVGQSRARAAAALHAAGPDGKRGVSARQHRGDARDARRDRPDLPGAELLLRRSERRLPRPDRPQRRDSTRACEQHRLSGGRRPGDRGDALPSGATSPSSNERW